MNAMESRKLEHRTRQIEIDISDGNKKFRKQFTAVRDDIETMQRSRTITVDDFLQQVKARAENMSKGEREKNERAQRRKLNIKQRNLTLQVV